MFGVGTLLLYSDVSISFASQSAEKDLHHRGPTLKQTVRFGRRLALPSTVEIFHEMRVLLEDENLRQLCAEADGLPLKSSWDEICSRRSTLSRSCA